MIESNNNNNNNNIPPPPPLEQQKTRDSDGIGATEGTAASEGIVDNSTPTPPVKLTVPKLKLRVPKEFQKSVDDVLSPSESDEEEEEEEEAEEKTSEDEEEETSGDHQHQDQNQNQEEQQLLQSSIQYEKSINPSNNNYFRLTMVNSGNDDGVFRPENNTGTHWRKNMSSYEHELDEESTMNRQQHEHQPPGGIDYTDASGKFRKFTLNL